MIDWDDAFDNSGYVPGAGAMLERCRTRAAAYAAKQGALDVVYGPGPRNRLDLFVPDAPPLGLVVFVHGGYWHLLDKSLWSHFARGPLSRGWAVAIPSYTLAPQARIAQIVRDVAAAVSMAAQRVPGPVRLVGHSAGGHLVSRLACLEFEAAARVEKVVSVSGVHDLRPLLNTRLNDTLRLDATEAEAESPALLMPRSGISCLFWVGANERPELVRQTRLIAEAWDASNVYEPGHDHFSVIEALEDPDSPLVTALLAP